MTEPWLQTFTGRKFYPKDPIVEDIHIVDIAHSLSMQCRFGGHTKKFYSVAEHSVLVSENVREEDALWGLLHDASEAYLIDVPRPIKKLLPNYAELEEVTMAAVCMRFGLNLMMPPTVKHVDNCILLDERNALLNNTDGWRFDERPLGIEVYCWQPPTAKLQFLQRFHSLIHERFLSHG